MPDPDARIPLGTLSDFEGQPKTVLRDYDSIVIPAMTVTLEGLAALLDLLDKGVDEIGSYRAQRDEDEDFAEDAASPGRPGATMSIHPKAEGIARIRISFPRSAPGTGEVLAVYTDGIEDMVGSAIRTENKPGSSRGWSAELWASHPSLLEGHLTWAARAKDLEKSLTESVKAKGPWWE